MFDPETNPETNPETSPAPPTDHFSMNPLPRLGTSYLALGLKTNVTSKSGFSSRRSKGGHQYPSAAALEAAAQNFPEILPPSAESLSADAPPEVLEAELKRLLGDWTRGLDVLGDLLADVGGSGGVGSSSSRTGAAVSGRGGPAPTPRHRRGRNRARGRGHGRRTGDGTDAGVGLGDLSLGGNDDFSQSDADISSITKDKKPEITHASHGPLPPAE